MFGIELTPELRDAVHDLVAPSKKVAEAVKDMSDRYRAGEGTCPESDVDVAAYAAYRMPAIYAAVHAALEQVRSVFPRWNPESLLDVGAGPGTSMWAALSIWPDIQQVDLIERDERMIRLGKQLASRSSSEAIRNARWSKADAGDIRPGLKHDLVIMAYVLGELQERRGRTVERLWQSTGGVLLLVEPGTPAGFSRIREARDDLLAQGARVVAPCPHGNACPMSDKDWCHFSQRISRSRLHKQVKSGDLGYEDEKFSYVAASRAADRPGAPKDPIPTAGRILRHPQIRPGHIKFRVCTAKGLETIVVSKKDKDLFRKARDAKWGSPMPARHEPESSQES